MSRPRARNASILITVILLAAYCPRAPAATTAEALLQSSGFEGGVIVCWGCDEELPLGALAASAPCRVQGLEADSKRVDAVHRQIVDQKSGKNVSVCHWNQPLLPYADNSVNLLIVQVPLDEHSRDVWTEILRVLVPSGKAVIKKAGNAKCVAAMGKPEVVADAYVMVTKPRSEKMDDWTHWLHGPDGNPVSQDTLSGPPARMQWMAEPRHGRSHDLGMSMTGMVTSGGKIFYFADEGPVGIYKSGDHQLDQWMLVCRDAYNGILLWKRPVADWGMGAWSPQPSRAEGYGPWSINPRMIHKRIVAQPDRLIVTPGFTSPVVVIDTKTGNILKTIPGTEFTSEIIVDRGAVYAVLDHAAQKAGRYTNSPRNRIVRIDLEAGKIAWQSHDISGVVDKRTRGLNAVLSRLQIAAGDGNIFYLDRHETAALDAATGKLAWRFARPNIPASIPKAWDHVIENPWDLSSLMYHDGILYFWQGQSQAKEQNAYKIYLQALSAQTGESVWEKECGSATFRSSLPPLYVAQGLLWVEGMTGGNKDFRASHQLTGLDPKTGEAVKAHDVGYIFRTHHHHRCYPNRATERHLIYSRNSLEYVDFNTGEIDISHWERGMCQYGIMPANGLLYSPANPCACFPSSQINGTVAYADQAALAGHAVKDRLLPGAATPNLKAPAADWPMYRHDAMRSAATAAAGPDRLTVAWTAALGEPISAPTIGDGRVFVATQNSRQVVALDAATGKTVWTVRTEGRVDTPPTLVGDSLFFGTSDGYAYCLKQSDGALCWRFNANPACRRMICFGQIESAWPIHGSVLVQGNTVIFVAGRSTFIDGGLELYKLDATTGTVIDHKTIATVDYRVDTTKDPPRLGWGTTVDLLVSDGTTIHLKSLAINTADFATTRAPWTQKLGNSRSYPGTPLLAIGGFLDDSLYDREGWCLDGQYGKIFAFNGEHACWMQWLNQVNTWHKIIYNVGTHRYQICSGHRQSPSQPSKPSRRVRGRVRPTPRRWETPVDVRVTALALAEKGLYCTGVPASADIRSLRSAIEGKQGGLVKSLDTDTGKVMAAAKLPAAPMWDAVAVADRALFICLQDGRIIRLQ